MAAFWAVFTFGGSGPALTAHGSLDLKKEIQIQNQIQVYEWQKWCMLFCLIAVQRNVC
jgi:hypothetical protein